MNLFEILNVFKLLYSFSIYYISKYIIYNIIGTIQALTSSLSRLDEDKCRIELNEASILTVLYITCSINTLY